MAATIPSPEAPASPPDSAKPNAWAVEGTGIIQRYHDTKLGRERTVLDGINLSIAPGEFCSVVGPSGCGKSTLLRLILGAESPKGGTLALFGQPAGPPDRHRGIVYQRYSLFPNMTVLDNVIFGLELERINFLMKWIWYPGYQRVHRMFQKEGLALLERVGLAEHAWKYPYQLSGGQQQRVAIAQALVMKPQVLLMDEPFGALDPGTREGLQEWMLEIHARERPTVFFVTHDLEEAIYLGTRVLVLSQYFEHPAGTEGARVVADLAPPAMEKRALRTAPELARMKERILALGFHPEKRQSPADFALEHPHARR